jgi:His-Xaa-Ser system protein HxsD
LDIKIKNGELLVIVDSDMYNIDVIHKCFYWYSSDFNVDIDKILNNKFQIKIIPKENQSSNEDLNKIVEKVKKDLIDFKLRDIITKETKTLRELLIAKAFMYYGLNENLIANASDPKKIT